MRQKTHPQTCSLALREGERARRSRFSRVGAGQGPPTPGLPSVLPMLVPGRQKDWLLETAQVSAQPTKRKRRRLSLLAQYGLASPYLFGAWHTEGASYVPSRAFIEH